LALAETAQLAVRINLEGNASAGIDKLNRKVGTLGTSVGRMGRGFGQIGSGLARAGLFVGGAAVAGLTGAAKAAIDFEDAFAGVRKTVDEADLKAAGLSFESLERSFRDMATTVPIAATEFARLGETAGALGVKAGDIDDFVLVTAKLGVTTDLTADMAADALGRIGTILNFTGRDYENFADSLVALGNAGASTESEIIEISKRFAAEGRAAGLATTEIAGLASATASLGFAPERGGTALARVFANMGTNISLANKKGKAFSEITGRSIKDLQSSLDKGDGLGIFMDVLKEIKGLSPTDANRTLKALGITNNSDRTIFRTMAESLPFVNEQLGIAADATGALSEEATKRFDTVRSKIQLLKNNLIEAGITIGEGFAPALGRAAEKLSDFLKDPGNKGELKALGEDIGAAIDDIDWAEVLREAKAFVGILKTALGVVMSLVSAVNRLPTEIKGAVAGLLVLNKLSGGLIGAGLGNVVGGLAGAATQGLASRAPGVGRLFAQPVFVTNWPLGGLGGGAGGLGGAAAGAGAIGAGLAGAAIVGAVAATVISTLPFVDRNNAQAAKGLNKAEIAAVNYYAADRASQQTIAKRLGYVPDKADADAGNAKLNAKVESLESTFERKQQDLKQVTERVKAAQLETKRETTRGSGIVSQTTRAGSANIVSAIYANRPQTFVSVNVNATTVSKTYNVSQRYGNKNGSRNQDSNGSGTLGNGGR
jgi:TP901 family phage tail tape measure protein